MLCEIDELGDYDPHSTGKAITELAVMSYRRSFFQGEERLDTGAALRSDRAGNVIGKSELTEMVSHELYKIYPKK